MSILTDLQTTIEDLVQKGKGILAADESNPTMARRFKPVGVESTFQSRGEWRSLLLETSGLGKYISGIILFEETLTQTAEDGTPLPEVAEAQGIVPGIKVDKGTILLVNSQGDLVTEGLDGLAERLRRYKKQGARFAKWRAVYPVGQHNPKPLGVKVNAQVLARYAAICQSLGIVPIVEPEVLIDGDHTIVRCFEVIERVQQAVYKALFRYHVSLEHTILKTSMVTPGKDNPHKACPEEVAENTIKVLRRTVPAAVPGINFLSGGQSDEEATANLNAMNRDYPGQPWEVSFSYGRALQHAALNTWLGMSENRRAAQAALLKRARLNSAARNGKYTPGMEG